MGSAHDFQKTEKKKIFKDLKNKLCGAFHKKKHESKDKESVSDEQEYNANDPPKLVSLASMLADFDRLKLEQAKRKESIKSEIDDEELHNVFSYKIVKKQQNISCSSNDSGFGEKSDEDANSAEKENKDNGDPEPSKEDAAKEAELVATLSELELSEDGGKRAKKTQQVYIARGKEAQKGFKVQPFAPYQTFSNRQILSGGQVTVNQVENAYTDINAALSNVERTVRYHAQTTRDEMLENLNLAQEFVHNESREQGSNEEFNAELSEIYRLINSELEGEIVAPASYEPYNEEATNPIEEFHLNEVPPYSDYDTYTETLLEMGPGKPPQEHDNFLTPPRSNENIFNPDSPANSFANNRSIYSVHSPISEYTLSPSESLTLSHEQYQEFPVFPDLPESVVEQETLESPRERQKSSASLNLKQFKDMQNKLSSDFAKEECCKKEVGMAREEFKAMFMRLDEKVREGLCLRLAALPLRTCYGVLHHVLMGLSAKSERDDMLCGIFCLICERVLVERPELFVEDFGLNLLKAAALRCWSRPSLTRYLVQSIRLALDTPAVRGLHLKEVLFTETDRLGDTLLGALARRGDNCAAVLAEIVRPHATQLPLFPIDHCNADGMSALHLACAGHGSTRSLHTVHVLLEHAAADVWLGDITGGDTALHYAVKPGACDLDLVMTLFKHVDRKKWKQLAHATNRSQVTPIETARAATKSNRFSYPEEVLSFLKKCRT